MTTLTVVNWILRITNTCCVFVWISHFWIMKCYYSKESDPFFTNIYQKSVNCVLHSQASPKLYRVHWKSIFDQHFIHFFTNFQSKYLLTWRNFFLHLEYEIRYQKKKNVLRMNVCGAKFISINFHFEQQAQCDGTALEMRCKSNKNEK